MTRTQQMFGQELHYDRYIFQGTVITVRYCPPRKAVMVGLASIGEMTTILWNLLTNLV